MQSKPIEHLAPVGRILLTVIFLASAFGKFAQWQDTVKMVADKNLPNPEVLLAIAVALEIVGGAMVLLGLYARLGAVALLLFSAPATVIMHNFWAYDGSEQMVQMINFMKNIAIMGGVTMVLALGAGPISIDHMRRAKSSVAA